ncbi:LytS/YhcK type 5TM receptor domain-containing protein [Psychrobacter sp. AOP7-C1-14]|uniref:LytS/YhcK type 5TM receptor domain-containing protein n=2 Tax=unclassified Psychrobacter TaxID=196806 RepID=UPI003FBA3E5D
MWEILIQMLLRMTLIITIAFLITRLSIFRKMIYHRVGIFDLFFLTVIFGMFGVIGNYTALVVEPGNHTIISDLWNPTLQSNNAVVDTRNIGIIIGGFFAGPIVGVGASLLAGAHRLLMGGFISSATFWVTILGGCLAGWFGYKWRGVGLIKPKYMFFISIGILTIQILVIPVLTADHTTALTLISFTGPPIIIINSIGIWICAMIFYNAIQEEERTRANQTVKTFSIADQTFSLFRSGLNEESAKKSTEIIKKLTAVEHVAITRGLRELAYTGEVTNQKRNDKEELISRKSVLATGKSVLNESKSKWLFSNKPSSRASVVVPFCVKNKVIGTLSFYYRSSAHITSVEKELIEGLGKLFSNQLELGEIERHNQLLQNAKIESLQSQLQPHFLFNALNTIVALCRIDPMLARDLLVHLSTYLRNSLTGIGDFLVPVRKEMDNVQAYLAIEQARFPDKVTMRVEVDSDLMDYLIPPFIIQPLVENAIKHGGFKRIQAKGVVCIEIKKVSEVLISIKVSDNGVGIESNRIVDLGERVVTSSRDGSGTALFNIKERLTALYSQEVRFNVDSEIGIGTCVSIILPAKN